MSNGLNLQNVRNNPATKGPETEQDVKDRLNPTQPVSGDNDVASQSPEEVKNDPPTPAEERKDTLASKDLRDKLEASVKDAEESNAKSKSADDGAVRYSSHPILRYKLGRFRFENGLLTLREQKDIDDFEENLKHLPASERIRIKKLDLSAAEAQVRAVLENGPKASKRIGSETGDRQPSNQVGKGTLESQV